MNRRDLFLLRIRSGMRVVDVPCERLYMRYLDTQRPRRSGTVQDDYFLGEPEPDYAMPSARELFDGLSEDLRGADMVRVIGQQWLADPEFRREVNDLLVRFQACGGRIEFVSSDAVSLRSS